MFILVTAIAWIMGYVLPNVAFAHSALIKAVPAQDSQLTDSPPQVVLTFNERVEKEVYYIRLLDQDGKRVTKTDAAISKDQQELNLELPPLNDGNYIVTYRVISADGHPIEGSYVIAVGIADSHHGINDPAFQDEMKKHILQHEHQLSGDIGIIQILMYASRAIFILSLLLFTGWIFWFRVLSIVVTEEVKQTNEAWALKLQRIFHVALIVMMGFQLNEMMNEWQLDNLLSLLLGTGIGVSWIISLVLSFSGFFVLYRWRWIDLLWIVLLLTAKSMNGHAMAFEPFFRTMLLDIVHLLAAAVWAGGLLYILVHWRHHREHIAHFLPQFSKLALLSLVTLTVTGILTTLIFIPRLSYLFYTQWGNFLLVKIGLVFLVIVVGGVLRVLLAKKQDRLIGRMLKLDFSLMIAITLIGGIFTHLNPHPINEPLHWHEMANKIHDIHMSLDISPNIPGKNKFTVQVWLPEDGEELGDTGLDKPEVLGKPKRVQLLLKYMDDEEIAPIEVPLVESPVDQESEVYAGFQHSNYSIEGAYLPLAGKWEMEIRVMDMNDNETVYFKEMLIY